MARRNPNEAFQIFVDPLREALHCVTWSRLLTRTPNALQSNVHYSVTLNDHDLVRLRGELGISLRVGIVIRIDEFEPASQRERFGVYTIEYFYQVYCGEREIVAFHFTPEAKGNDAIQFPHVHIGWALVGEQRLIRPDDFHKIHIPTGRVSLEAVVRLAITEFQVQPLRPNWEEILAHTESAHDT